MVAGILVVIRSARSPGHLYCCLSARMFATKTHSKSSDIANDFIHRCNEIMSTKTQTLLFKAQDQGWGGLQQRPDGWILIRPIPFIKVCEQKQFWAACTCLSYNPSMIDSPLSKLTAPYSIYSPLEYVHIKWTVWCMHVHCICRHIWCSWPSLRWSVLRAPVN